MEVELTSSFYGYIAKSFSLSGLGCLALLLHRSYSGSLLEDTHMLICEC